MSFPKSHETKGGQKKIPISISSSNVLKVVRVVFVDE